MLGFEHAMTIDSAQGATTIEHINALPRGTANLTAFKTYTAESRHVRTAWTMIAEGALLEAETLSRAVGDVSPVTPDHLWDRAAADMAEQKFKALGVELMKMIQVGRDKSTSTERWLKFQLDVETMSAQGQDASKIYAQKVEQDAAATAIAKSGPNLAAAIERGATIWSAMNEDQLRSLERTRSQYEDLIGDPDLPFRPRPDEFRPRPRGPGY